MSIDQVTSDLKESILASIKPILERREADIPAGHSFDINRESLVRRIKGISMPVVRDEVDKIMDELGYQRGCCAGSTLGRYYYWKYKK